MTDESTQNTETAVSDSEGLNNAPEGEQSEQDVGGAEAHAEAVEERSGTDWKAEARKWESRAKENKSAADELEKLRVERDDLSGRVSAFEVREERASWAREVAEEAGVPADVLRGETRDEMAAHAQEIKTLLSSARGPVVPAQGKTGRVNVTDPNREAVRTLFGNEN